MQIQWGHKIFTLTEAEFGPAVLEIFRYQYVNNSLYREYTDALHKRIAEIRSIEQIPFLPISFFKTHPVVTGLTENPVVFESSGTTGMTKSRHLVSDISLYRNSFLKGFEIFYGDIKDYCILGLLPSYLERDNSSLVYMVNEWIKESRHPHSGFYLDEFDKLSAVLKQLESEGQKTLLIGVSFALLDFAAIHAFPLRHTIVMETGGMKGRREEMLKEEMHKILQESFSIAAIHSEYGMTELLSQAYSRGAGIFHTPSWMRVLVREEEDPLSVKSLQRGESISGVINVIDLANINSCCFIATDDAGRLLPDGSFEVLGRVDNSDLRGCSLLVR